MNDKPEYTYSKINDKVFVYELDGLRIVFSGNNNRLHINIDNRNQTIALPDMTRKQGRMLIEAIEAAIVKA